MAIESMVFFSLRSFINVVSACSRFVVLKYYIRYNSLMRTILVTGAAGFIGAALCKELAKDSRVIGVDNLNTYYDVNLKLYRLDLLKGNPLFTFVKGDLCDRTFLDKLFTNNKFDLVVNLAAQAGVRYSIENPDAYIQSNIIGFYNILEECRIHKIHRLIYASSSSVYGASKSSQFATSERTDFPVSLYAATKKCDELLAYSYAKLYGFECSGLRFFTVYGPAGRPDMAYFKFAERIRMGLPIEVYNHGNLYRDFTYIDDIVQGILAITKADLPTDPFGVPASVFNIGNNHPVKLLDFINTLEGCLLESGVIHEPARKILLPMQPGDVPSTCADISDLERIVGFKPSTQLKEGLTRFVQWYKDYIS